MAQIASIILERYKNWFESIKSIIIVNPQGDIVLSLNNGPCKEQKDEIIISKFMLAMNSFAREIGGYKLKMVELGKDKIYSLKDESTEFLFIVVSHNESKTKKISKKLQTIRDIFIERCMDSANSDSFNKEEIKIAFYNALEQNGAKSVNLDSFLTTL
jgi:hypothetical protein